MKKYICRKEVEAFKIKQIKPVAKANTTHLIGEDISLILSAEWVGKYKPEVGGYFVKSGDGQKSYISAKVFEKGFTCDLLKG